MPIHWPGQVQSEALRATGTDDKTDLAENLAFSGALPCNSVQPNAESPITNGEKRGSNWPRKDSTLRPMDYESISRTLA